MRILIISYAFPPLNTIASHRPYFWAKYWREEGHEVTVLTVRKDIPSSQQLKYPALSIDLIEVPLRSVMQKARRFYHKYLRKGNPSQGEKKAPQKKFLSNVGERLSFFHSLRMPHHSDLWRKPAYDALSSSGKKWDVVVSSFAPYVAHQIAWDAKKAGLAKKWIADFRDLWTQNKAFPGYPGFRFFEEKREKRFLHEADYVTVVSEGLKETLSSRCERDKIHVIENGFDPTALEALPTESFFQENDEEVRFVYTGSIYPGKRDPRTVFEAIALLAKKKKIDHLKVYFSGPRLHTVEELAEEYGVGRFIKTLGFLSYEDALRMQRDAHAILFLDWNDLEDKGVMTGKVFENVFSGSFVLSVGGSEDTCASQFIVNSGAGEATGCDVEKTLASLEKILASPKRRPILNQDYLAPFTRRVTAEKMSALFSTMEPVKG